MKSFMGIDRKQKVREESGTVQLLKTHDWCLINLDMQLTIFVVLPRVIRCPGREDKKS